MREVIGTLAFGLVNLDGFLMADESGRAYVFNSMEAADAFLLTDPDASAYEPTLIDVSAPAGVSEVAPGKWNEWIPGDEEDEDEEEAA